MKHIITLFVFSSILTPVIHQTKRKALQKSTPMESETISTLDDSTKEFKNIDTDEALIQNSINGCSKKK
jgi:hypothetical protein